MHTLHIVNVTFIRQNKFADDDDRLLGTIVDKILNFIFSIQQCRFCINFFFFRLNAFRNPSENWIVFSTNFTTRIYFAENKSAVYAIWILLLAISFNRSFCILWYSEDNMVAAIWYFSSFYISIVTDSTGIYTVYSLTNLNCGIITRTYACKADFVGYWKLFSFDWYYDNCKTFIYITRGSFQLLNFTNKNSAHIPPWHK